MLRLIRAALYTWRTRGWRKISTDPPPLGLQVLALCDYTGVRGVTTRRADIKYRQWDHWYMNHPTHWRPLPPALALAVEPPAAPPLYEFTDKKR